MTIKTGSKHGIDVTYKKEAKAYHIEVPNFYDVYYSIKKDAELVNDPDLPKNRRLFSIPEEKAKDPETAAAINEKVEAMRTVYQFLDKERSQFEKDLDKQLGKEKDVVFVYKTPEKNFCTGEVVKAGSYYVALKSEAEDKIYVRMINTARFLNSAKDFKERDQVIADRFKIGSKLYLQYDKNGSIKEEPYVAKVKQQERAM